MFKYKMNMTKRVFTTHLLLDKNYFNTLLQKALNNEAIQSIKSQPIKIAREAKFEHIVLAATVTMKSGDTHKLYIMSHSNGNKKKLYDILQFFKTNIDHSYVSTPEPLIYDEASQSLVYRELTGSNLYEYLENKAKGLQNFFSASGQALAQIHKLKPTKKFGNLNLAMTDLDPSHIMDDIKTINQSLYNRLNQVQHSLNELKQKLDGLKQSRPVLVHGDLHPENIIIIDANINDPKLGMIDLENVSLADREYDLGSFIEQTHIMASPSHTVDEINTLQTVFLDSYLAETGLTFDSIIENKILFYKTYFGLKAAIFYFRLNWLDRQKIIIFRIEEYIEKLKQFE